MDEYTKQQLNNDDDYQHGDKYLWSNVHLDSVWVPYFKKFIQNIANQNGDPILDWHTLSLQYIEYFNRISIPTHVDSLHWCAGGLGMAGNVILQNELIKIHKKKLN